MIARRSGRRAASAIEVDHTNDFRQFLDIVSLTMPNRIVLSAWLEHAPFAFWLIKQLRPQTLVELGTYHGFSYLTFCQAVQSLRLETKCYAIDTWRGDPHSDTYGPEVLKELVEYHDARYSAFSRLTQSTFDDAVTYFEDGSLDLLHIDGYHTYDAVKHDFEIWKPKLSSRGLVVLHDTNVREREFGVWELWSELKAQFPSFEYVHGHGLGILGVGGKLPPAIRSLLKAASDPTLTSDIREAYARLGAAVSNQWTLQDRDRENARLAREHAGISRELQNRDRENALLGEEHARVRAEREQLYQDIAATRSHASDLLTALQKRSGEADSLRDQLFATQNRASNAEAEINDQAREVKRLGHELSTSHDRIGKLEAVLAERGAVITRLVEESARAQEQTGKLAEETTALRDELETVRRRADAAADALHAQLAKAAAPRLTGIATRAATRLKRRMVSITPVPADWSQRDGRLHRMLAWAWWTLTLQLYSKLKVHRACATLSASGLFDRDWYLEHNADIRASGVDPLVHYVNHGAAEGRDPNPFFDSDWYLERNADVRRAKANPLQHYVNHGAAEGRDPSPLFDNDWYIDANPDIRSAGLNPLAHYLHHGAAEGRRPRPDLNRKGYQEWIEAYDTISARDVAEMKRFAASFAKRPLLSIVMPVYNTPERFLREAIESIRVQTYDRWELCIADDCSTDAHVGPLLEQYRRADPRIKIIHRKNNGHIARASNSALELAAGDWIILMDHDDTIAPHALFCVVDAINRNPDLKLIYSDEDKIGPNGQRRDAYFKSDWNPDLFLSHNMFSHLGAYQRELVAEVGGFRSGYDGSQDYDLTLRCLERITPQQIHHIPHVLYHWRMAPGSASLDLDEKPYAMRAGERAINDHLQRRGVPGRAQLIGFGYRIQYRLPEAKPLVSIIIPTRNAHELVRRCLSSIRGLTRYPSYEIILVDNGSDDPAALAYFSELCAKNEVRIIRDARPFNYSALNNLAAEAAHGTVLALLNNDVQVRSRDWLTEMVSIAIRPGVGAVGARLWYHNDRLQHGGLMLSPVHIAMNAHQGMPRTDPGYFGRAALQQSLSAVTAACLVVRKELYLMIGGLNERDLPVAYSDVDFCLRLSERGFRTVWTPYAELYHEESATRGRDDTAQNISRFQKERDYMRQRWYDWLDNDPAYSPNLTIERSDFSLAFPPRIEMPWRISPTPEGASSSAEVA